MLRCEHCGGHAQAGLAHLHNLMKHLCWACCQAVLELRKAREELNRAQNIVLALTAHVAGQVVARPLKEAA